MNFISTELEVHLGKCTPLTIGMHLFPLYDTRPIIKKFLPACYDTLFAAPAATFSLRLTGFVVMLVLLPGAVVQSIGTVVAALFCVHVC